MKRIGGFSLESWANHPLHPEIRCHIEQFFGIMRSVVDLQLQQKALEREKEIMLTIQVQDLKLEKQLTELLEDKFDGNPEQMLKALLDLYLSQLNRLKYSGILKWEKDGLTYQKEIRWS